MRLISTGLRSVQGPSHVYGSSLINSDTFSRMGEIVRQFSIQNNVNVSHITLVDVHSSVGEKSISILHKLF